MKHLEQYWYRSRAPLFLLPLSWLFRLLVVLRRWAYRLGVFSSYGAGVPVIVIGNISVGGTGKTPLVTWVVKLLQKTGYRPGIITRGYGGQARRWPQQVRPDSDPVMVGDEPVLLAQRCGCPVVAAPDRVVAAKTLLQYSDCNILVSDDGMQHYRLKRDIEIAVVDGERRFGNGQCLPAGPLREPPSRLKDVDLVVTNGYAGSGEFMMKLVPGPLISLDGSSEQPLENLKGKEVHALAGIGNPKRFFDLLRLHNIEVREHSFPDHHGYVADDLDFGDENPVLMTEKDAVKCRRFADQRMWYLPVDARMNETFAHRFLQLLKKITH